jgi:hypothetical protein
MATITDAMARMRINEAEILFGASRFDRSEIDDQEGKLPISYQRIWR